jgi:hypothetical protein
MEARRPIKFLDGSFSPQRYSREEVQLLADRKAAEANRKDRLRNFWRGVVYMLTPKTDRGFYWRISVEGGSGGNSNQIS